MIMVDNVAVVSEEEYSSGSWATALDAEYVTVMYRSSEGYALGPLGSPGCERNERWGCQACFIARVSAANVVMGREQESSLSLTAIEGESLPKHIRELVAWQSQIELEYPKLLGGLAATVWYDVRDGVSTCRLLLRMSDCEKCGRVWLTSQEAGEGSCSGVQSFGTLDEMHEELNRIYVDPRVGLIPNLVVAKQHGLHVARAAVLLGRPSTSGSTVVHSWGRGVSREAAESLAVLEALERWSGVPPEPTRLGAEAIHCTQAELPARALTPKDLWVHRDAVYNKPGSRFAQLYADERLWWRRGEVVSSEEVVYVPFSSAYFAVGAAERGLKRYVQENSNGMAVGQSLRHATLNGLLELIERDAFLATWWRRGPAACWFQIAPGSFPMSMAAGVAAMKVTEAGFDISVGVVPSKGSTVTAIAVATGSTAALPRHVVAAACGTSRGDAVRKAIEEIASTTRLIMRLLPRVQRSDVQKPSDVLNAMHHWLLYAQAAGDALWNDSGFVVPEDIPVWSWDAEQRSDSTIDDELECLVSALSDEELEPIVVDLTRPELAGVGLSAAKVFMPGTLPLTFGYGMERLDQFEDGDEGLLPHPLG